ncbi:MAG: hypothetical protein AMS17_08270 [Spirochaetes bacterium DG_61]|nr:MAG: hypothetical protein AMS17_08270 [Spirochaetes bacterium DG_61]
MGYLGGSLGLALKKNVPEAFITGIDKGSILIRAENVGAIDNGCIYSEIETVLKDAELVFLTTPINTTLEILPKVASAVNDNAIVSDTALTKREVMETARELFRGGATFIGGHPVVGIEKGEIEDADPYIFSNGIYALVPLEECSPHAMGTLQELINGIGARPIVVSAEEHDELFGGINHMLQLIAMAHVSSVFSRVEEKSLSVASAFCGERFKQYIEELLTPSYIWDDIFSSNYKYVIRNVDRFIEELKRITETLNTKNFEHEYERVKKLMGGIPISTKGFKRELFHLFITIQDSPGSISRLVGLLVEEGFDIRDIELVRIRVGEAGTLRISFDSQNTASKAGRFLMKSGYSCRTQYEYRDFYY